MLLKCYLMITMEAEEVKEAAAEKFERKLLILKEFYNRTCNIDQITFQYFPQLCNNVMQKRLIRQMMS